MKPEELDRINRAEEIQRYTENRCETLEKENRLLKSLLYCTKETCDNCGYVNCENFQRQRKSEPCALYLSYKDRIKKLEHRNCVDCSNHGSNIKLLKAKKIIKTLLRLWDNVMTEETVKALITEAEQFLKEVSE